MMFKLKGLPRKKKSTINRKNQDTIKRSLWTPIPQKLTSSGLQYFLRNYPRYFLFHPLSSWLMVTQQMKGIVFCAASVFSWFLTLPTCPFEHYILLAWFLKFRHYQNFYLEIWFFSQFCHIGIPRNIKEEED